MRRVLAAVALVGGCAPGALRLEAPNIAPSVGRAPTSVTLDPIAARGTIVGDFAPPGPAAVLTATMGAELRGRALRGGEAGGYGARCALDRFAVRTRTGVTDATERLVLYADLSCEARRAADGAVVWRGELRARTCSEGANMLGGDSSATQRLASRAMSDAGRELASDLALRALGLEGDPSARVFPDADHERDLGGLDDGPFGPAALAERLTLVDGALASSSDGDVVARAGAWNVAAMAVGPGDRWPGGDKLELADEPRVRFEQYKALARLGSPAALEQLRAATGTEGDGLLAELLADALRSRGIGLERSRPPRTP